MVVVVVAVEKVLKVIIVKLLQTSYNGDRRQTTVGKH